MQKFRSRFICVISILLITFAIGINFLIHTKIFTPYRMVLVDTIDSNDSKQTNIYTQITEHTDPTIIDDIERTLMYAESLPNVPKLPQNPDLHVTIISPRFSAIVCEFNLWQQGDSLIIQLRHGMDDSDSLFKRADNTTLLQTLKVHL